MVVWGEASYKVKRAITFHQRFTVAQIVDATELSYEQVEQVVQRLIDQGYVRKLRPDELYEVEKAAARKVGRPRQRYALTEDGAKREEFFASVEAIASAERMSRAGRRRPDTPYYHAALEAIREMESDPALASEARLEEAAAQLAYGRDYEALVPEGAEIAQAYYDLAQARLEMLRSVVFRRRVLSERRVGIPVMVGGGYNGAEELFIRAREAFQAAGLDEEAERCIEGLLCMKIRRQLSRARRADIRVVSVRAVEEALNIVQEADIADRPLLPLLREALEMLIAALPDKTIEEIAKEASARTAARIEETLEETIREKILGEWRHERLSYEVFPEELFPRI